MIGLANRLGARTGRVGVLTLKDVGIVMNQVILPGTLELFVVPVPTPVVYSWVVCGY